MKVTERKRRVKPPRIRLTDDLMVRLKTETGGSVPRLAKRAGLPYGLVYNIVHGRVRTISARHFQRLFNESPPEQKHQRIDAGYFRSLVQLWLYLNDDNTKTGLYRELSGRRYRKVDYRIFSGKTETVKVRWVRAMEMKFFNSGIDRVTLDQWIDEFERRQRDERVPYSKIRPLLWFLYHEMGAHPTTLLNQFIDRYERGELKSVSSKVYDHVIEIHKRSENALKTGDALEIARIKEQIAGGGRKGYTLYAEVARELRFLQQYAKIGPKRYLGRSTYMYEKGGCKRIPTWRAHRILADCDAFIRRRMDLPLAQLPISFQRLWVWRLRSALLARAADLLSRDEGIVLEKRILSPTRNQASYTVYDHGFTQFDRAPSSLGMRKAAFDLMVAQNCEIFRTVGRYSRRWYLSDLYLKELSENPYFKLVSEKYERLASCQVRGRIRKSCLAPNVA